MKGQIKKNIELRMIFCKQKDQHFIFLLLFVKHTPIICFIYNFDAEKSLQYSFNVTFL